MEREEEERRETERLRLIAVEEEEERRERYEREDTGRLVDDHPRHEIQPYIVQLREASGALYKIWDVFYNDINGRKKERYGEVKGGILDAITKRRKREVLADELLGMDDPFPITKGELLTLHGENIKHLAMVMGNTVGLLHYLGHEDSKLSWFSDKTSAMDKESSAQQRRFERVLRKGCECRVGCCDGSGAGQGCICKQYNIPCRTVCACTTGKANGDPRRVPCKNPPIIPDDEDEEDVDMASHSSASATPAYAARVAAAAHAASAAHSSSSAYALPAAAAPFADLGTAIPATTIARKTPAHRHNN